MPRRPALCLLVETSGDDAFVAPLVAAGADAYRKARGSLTGALQATARAAADALRRSPTPHIACGLSALIVDNDEALLATVEPAVCWRLREGVLERFPKESVWLDPNLSDEARAHMPGGLDAFDPDLVRISLQPGDGVMLGTTTLARDVGELLIAQALSDGNPCAALHRLAPDVDFTAIGFEWRGEGAHRAAARISSDMPASADAPALSQRESLQRPVGALRAAPRAASAPRRQSAPVPARLPRPAFQFHLPRFDPRPYLEVVAVAALFLFKALGMLLRMILTLFSRALPAREGPATRVQPTVRRPAFHSNPFDHNVLVAVAIAIPVLISIGILVKMSQTNADNQIRYNDLVRKAESAYQSAAALPAGEARRPALEAALKATDDAIAIQTSDASLRSDARARDLQATVSKELDVLKKAVTFFYYPLLYDFPDRDSSPTAVIARGADVYVLDAGLHRLYRFQLNETKDGLMATPTRPSAGGTPPPTPNPIVMRQGDERGPIVIGDLADIFWGSAGGSRPGGGVLTLTAQKQLLEFAPATGIAVLALGTPSGWTEATLGDSFGGNLYVLDGKANRILKFPPSGNDYKNAIDYVAPGQRVDFAGATDMAVDGFVWVLLADGTIMKFDSGNLLSFDKRGLDTPLRKPVAIVPQPSSQSVWVADAGNRRLVQFSRAGDFLRQLKPDDRTVMSDLRGFAMDEANKRFYWISGNRLYLGTLQN